MNQDADRELAPGWCYAMVAEICEAFNGKTFKAEEWGRIGLPIIRIQNLNNPNASFNYYDGELGEKHLVKHGDLLFAWSGTPGTSFGAHVWRGGDAALNQHIFKIHFSEHLLNKEYLRLALQQNVARYVEQAQGGVGLAHITKKKFDASLVPLPPLNEQHRIVAKIEELFSELDKGIENLKTAQAQLKVYRQALLKHAFEGKLTAQWREQHRDQLETATALQQRIQQERAQRYQQQLADWQANGGSKPKAPKPLPPLTAEELAELPELPEGWGWVRLMAIVEQGPINGYSPQSVKFETGTKAITLTATTSGKFDGSHFKYIDEPIPRDSSLWLKRGDILVQRGTTIEYVGVPAIYKGPENQFIYPDLIMKVRVVQSVDADYTVFSMSTARARNYLRGNAVGAAGSMPKINHATLRSLPLPLCSYLEQQKIVQELESIFSEVDQLELILTTSLQQAEALRQSILKRAFSGQLVPQDPHDEPASVLLERIRAERNQSEKPIRKGKQG